MQVVLAGLIPGGQEIWIILLVIVLLFGSTKIPNIARALGRSKGEFQQGLQEGETAASKAKGSNTEPEDEDDAEADENPKNTA